MVGFCMKCMRLVGCFLNVCALCSFFFLFYRPPFFRGASLVLGTFLPLQTLSIFEKGSSTKHRLSIPLKPSDLSGNNWDDVDIRAP